MKKLLSEKGVKRWGCAAVLLLAVNWTAVGQISTKAISKHEQLKRQSLKEASLVESTFKDSHLNMDIYTFRKGGAAKAGGRSMPLFRSIDGPDKETVQRNSAVREKKFRLFRKKKKDN